MKHLTVMIICLAFALVACQSSASTNAPASASEGDLETKGFVESGDGRLRVIGKSQLLVSLKNLSNAPAAPAGWEFTGPVFDVTAQDRQRRPVQKLAAALRLRFNVPTDKPVTVMVHTGKEWEIVPSEVDADGTLVADVDHFTPYTAAKPVTSQAAPNRTPSPKATVVTSSASSSDAQAAMENAVTLVKGKKSKVTAATGYTGSLYVPLPSFLQSSVNTVIANGAAYVGLYNAVNEVFAANAKSGSTSQGALALLVEPKTTMPASATDARNSLAALFTGVPVATLTQARADSTAFIFYATSGGTAYGAGYVTYNGLVLAYGIIGGGAYQSLVPKQ